MLVGRLWNHLIAFDIFFHRSTFVAAITFLLILSRIFLLMILISDFGGLINLQYGLLMKYGIRSFDVTNASFLAEVSMRSSSKRSWAIFFVCRGDVARFMLARLFVRFSFVFVNKG